MTDTETRFNPLKVLFFSPTLGGGGAEKQLLRLLQALDREAIQPHLSVARGGGSYESQLPLDVPVHVCTEGLDSSLASSLLSILSLRRRIDSLRPELVVSVLPHANAALVAAVRLSRHRPRVVLGMQNNFEAGMAQAPGVLRPSLRRLYLAAYRRADHLVALSQGVAGDLSQLVSGAEARTTVVYNAGVDEQIAKLSQVPSGLKPPQAPLIVACGRLNLQKDYPTMLRAVAQSSLSPAPHLWVLGEGSLASELQTEAESLGLGERVRWLGFQENPYAFMAAADVFALSSQWEGFANVVVEAMACGTPVVATDCPHGPGEILEGGRYGHLVPVGDPTALARALDEALTEGKSEALSDACRRRAARFDAVSSARGYQQVFEQLCAHSGA